MLSVRILPDMACGVVRPDDKSEALRGHDIVSRTILSTAIFRGPHCARVGPRVENEQDYLREHLIENAQDCFENVMFS